MVPLIINPIYTLYHVGIYRVPISNPLLNGSNRGLKQLGDPPSQGARAPSIPAKSRQDLFRQGWTKGLKEFSKVSLWKIVSSCVSDGGKQSMGFCVFFWGGWDGGKSLELVCVIFRRISGRLKWTFFWFKD